MDSKNIGISALSVGFVLILIAGMVSAVSVNGVVNSGISTNALTKVQLVNESTVDATTSTQANANVQLTPSLFMKKEGSEDEAEAKADAAAKIQARADLRAKLMADVTAATDSQLVSFKSAVKTLKHVIMDVKIKAKVNGNGGHPNPGWHVKEWINDSNLSASQKTQLLNAFITSKSSAAAGNWHRSSFLMWNMDLPFVAIGKQTTVNVDNSTFSYAVGFSSADHHRFRMVMGNGLIAGIQDNQNFWGTYSNGTAHLTMENGSTMSLQYKTY